MATNRHNKRKITSEEADLLKEFVNSQTYSLVKSELSAIISKQEDNLLSFPLRPDSERELLYVKLQLQGAQSLVASLLARLDNIRLASSSAQKKPTT